MKSLKKNNSLFSSGYETLMEKTLIEYCSDSRVNCDAYYSKRKYDLFFPSCGASNRKKVDFIIYGMATNGWGNDVKKSQSLKFTVNEIQNKNLSVERMVRNSKNYSNKHYKGEKNPLDWVNENYDKPGWRLISFFWPVSYMLVNCFKYGYHKLSIDEAIKLYKDEKSWLNEDLWYENMIWSNLMKIAPHEGGNPYGPAKSAQLDKCMDLFDWEINKINPQFVILLTNWENWGKYFLRKEQYDYELTRGKYVQAIAHPRSKSRTKIIVVKRERFGRSYKKWFGSINEILKHLYS